MKKIITGALIVGTMVMSSGKVCGGVFTIFEEDLSAFNVKIEDNTGFEAFFGNEVIPPVTPFNDGNALRMYDFATFDKPELRGETTPLLEPFRIDIQSYNASHNSTTPAIRFRMSNAGDSMTSEARSAFSLSWMADGRFTAKYSDSGLSDGDPANVNTIAIALNFDQVYDITMIANGNTSGTYSYSLFGENRTLNPLHYDVYVDGALLNSETDPWFSSGMKFTLEKSAATYDPALGLGQFGLVGNSISTTDPDVYFDNIIISTGENIPEPASMAMIGLVATGIYFKRRFFVD